MWCIIPSMTLYNYGSIKIHFVLQSTGSWCSPLLWYAEDITNSRKFWFMSARTDCAGWHESILFAITRYFLQLHGSFCNCIELFCNCMILFAITRYFLQFHGTFLQLHCAFCNCTVVFAFARYLFEITRHFFAIAQCFLQMHLTFCSCTVGYFLQLHGTFCNCNKSFFHRMRLNFWGR